MANNFIICGRAARASSRYLYRGEERGRGGRPSVVRRFPGFCTCSDGSVL